MPTSEGHARGVRTSLRDGLKEIEQHVLDSLGLVAPLIAEAVEAATTNDLDCAEEVVSSVGELDSSYGEVQDTLMALMACQAPVAGDLRLAMALVHINDRAERMGTQCLNIATMSVA